MHFPKRLILVPNPTSALTQITQANSLAEQTERADRAFLRAHDHPEHRLLTHDVFQTAAARIAALPPPPPGPLADLEICLEIMCNTMDEVTARVKLMEVKLDSLRTALNEQKSTIEALDAKMQALRAEVRESGRRLKNLIRMERETVVEKGEAEEVVEMGVVFKAGGNCGMPLVVEGVVCLCGEIRGA